MKEKEFLEMKEGTKVLIKGRPAKYLGEAKWSALGSGIVAQFEYSDTKKKVLKSNRQMGNG